ncbi:uncharacterized protein LOC122853027 isoform X2 [Aphidius gifuensis]|uniref:uncharacterized protein LOC122853027 isoform X2 n=1 Tax=Aphidius gifuensis TaxID=684658 RepID=UPI001CDCA533|nr:uncharacterized protein LOC122853027 isoform X2 [Aphidius gifuensis]
MAENLINQMEASSSAEDVKRQRVLLFEQFARKVELSIPKVDNILIKIISSINDIRPMNMELLKTEKFFEVWVCLMSRRMTEENSLIFEDGTCFTRQQLELIYGIDFVNAFVSFILSLQTFSPTELKLFTTVAVLSRTYSDNIILGKFHFFDNDRAVEKFKDFCADFFDFDISKKLLRLRELDEQRNNEMDWFRRNYWLELDISRQIAERLNIPVLITMPKSSANLMGATSIAEFVEMEKIYYWKQWAGTIAFYTQTQISFAHACLESLTKKDQACLLKHGLIEICFSTLSPYITRNAIVIRRAGFLIKHLELIYGPDFVDVFVETLLSLQACQLSTVEMKLFNEIVLLNQRPGLVDVEAVQRLQDRAIEKLSAERLKNQKNTNDVDIPTLDIPQMLSELQSLSSLHLNSLDWLKENSSKINLSVFLCELFDIPNFIFKILY